MVNASPQRGLQSAALTDTLPGAGELQPVLLAPATRGLSFHTGLDSRSHTARPQLGGHPAKTRSH